VGGCVLGWAWGVVLGASLGVSLGVSVGAAAIAGEPARDVEASVAILAAIDRELPCPDPPSAEGSDDALAMLGRGLWQLCTDQLDAAILTFKTLLAIDPPFAEGFDVDANLGHALRRRGDWDAAIAVYQQVVDRGGDPASGAHAALAALRQLQTPPPPPPLVP
jgi:tetratricopeptide (TPR) repeat protein